MTSKAEMGFGVSGPMLRPKATAVAGTDWLEPGCSGSRLLTYGKDGGDPGFWSKTPFFFNVNTTAGGTFHDDLHYTVTVAIVTVTV